MISDSNEKQSNVILSPEASRGEASASPELVDNALSIPEAMAHHNAVSGRSDAPGPMFVDDIGPLDVIPQYITKTNARELFGLRPGETVARALARMAQEG
ncbi:hypothetical protein WI90_29785 [Burkholderia ubonensis]|nr:hypothetical protein WI90_29785 [Burkholderia ubonensis]